MKTRTYISYALAFLSIAFFYACEKDADIELPKTEPKLVVVCFITPQDAMLSATVTRSNPIFQSYDVNTTSAVTDATVYISTGANTIQLQFDPALECYTAPVTTFPITAGTTYSLSVSTPQQETVNAVTTVPAQNVAGFSVIMTDSLEADMWYQHLSTTFDFMTTDHAAETNWYRFFSTVITCDTITQDTTSMRFMSMLLSDAGHDGQQLRQVIRGDWSNYNMTSNTKVVGYDCWMLNANRDYYSFHNSIYELTGDDPFSEPSLIYSNINGGLGVFAAANGTKIRIYR
jgi:hypothetical protein